MKVGIEGLQIRNSGLVWHTKSRIVINPPGKDNVTAAAVVWDGRRGTAPSRFYNCIRARIHGKCGDLRRRHIQN
jgi:hypothetical protein